MTVSPLSIDHTKAHSTSLVGSLTRTTFKLTQSATLAVSGVALMAIGVVGAGLTTQKVYEFYVEEGESASGYGNVPGFTTVCSALSNFSHTKTGFPLEDSTFCQSVSRMRFDDLNRDHKVAALAASLGTSTLSYLGSLYAFVGGMSLLGKSLDVFTSTLW